MFHRSLYWLWCLVSFLFWGFQLVELFVGQLSIACLRVCSMLLGADNSLQICVPCPRSAEQLLKVSSCVVVSWLAKVVARHPILEKRRPSHDRHLRIGRNVKLRASEMISVMRLLSSMCVMRTFVYAVGGKVVVWSFGELWR